MYELLEPEHEEQAREKINQTQLRQGEATQHLKAQLPEAYDLENNGDYNFTYRNHGDNFYLEETGKNQDLENLKDTPLHKINAKGLEPIERVRVYLDSHKNQDTAVFETSEGQEYTTKLVGSIAGRTAAIIQPFYIEEQTFAEYDAIKDQTTLYQQARDGNPEVWEDDSQLATPQIKFIQELREQKAEHDEKRQKTNQYSWEHGKQFLQDVERLDQGKQLEKEVKNELEQITQNINDLSNVSDLTDYGRQFGSQGSKFLSRWSNKILRTKKGSKNDYRAWYVDGTEFENLENQKIYTLSLMKKSEQKDVENQLITETRKRQDIENIENWI